MNNPNLKTVCDGCSSNYIVKHDLPEDYIEQYCPFCGETIDLDSINSTKEWLDYENEFGESEG